MPRSGGVWNSGSWRLRATERSPADIDGQVSELLARVTSNPDVWRKLSRYRVDVFCGLFMDKSNEGFELSPDTMRQLSNQGIKIGFDIYGPRDEVE